LASIIQRGDGEDTNNVALWHRPAAALVGKNDMPEKLLLKKYGNRRLYDTEKSSYVSLNRVADIIKQGRQVQVMDAKSNEDVTAFILTQIILEQARNKQILLPVPLLHLIIRYGENELSEFFENHLQQTIRNYLMYKRSADEQFKKWLEMGMDLSVAAQKSLTDLSPFKSFLELFAESAEPNKKDKQ
jgi:polyhydroxyalkanoate synthesis repressor PhaR